MLICWYTAAQKSCIIIIHVENRCAASAFVETIAIQNILQLLF